MRVAKGLHPKKLFIKQTDKIASIQEVQKVFNQQLKENIQSNNPIKIKVTVVNIVEETLTEPRSGSLEGVSDTVNVLVDEYTQDSVKPKLMRTCLPLQKKLTDEEFIIMQKHTTAGFNILGNCKYKSR